MPEGEAGGCALREPCLNSPQQPSVADAHQSRRDHSIPRKIPSCPTGSLSRLEIKGSQNRVHKQELRAGPG